MVNHTTPRHSAVPAPQGLYDPAAETENCGVAFVATLTGRPSHDIVEKALTALHNLDHRGASGAEPDSGDGAGILVNMPDRFLRDEVAFELPEAGRFAAGIAFLPVDPDERDQAMALIEQIAEEENLEVLGWRDMPIHPEIVGRTARSVMPAFKQLFIKGRDASVEGVELDRMAFCLRKRAETEADTYFPSLSSRTIVYKGMLTTGQLEPFFPIFPTPGLCPRWVWCIRASRRTPSPHGRWPTPTATWPTTARSTR